jgi:integrase
VKVELKHVHAVKKRLANGSVKIYYRHRRTGRPIKGEPGTLEFQASYEEACQFAERERAEVFREIVNDFFASEEFAALGDRTRADYLKHGTHIEREWSDLPLAALSDRRIKSDFRKWRDRLVKTLGKRQADYVFATCRRIVTFGMEEGKIEVNHLLDLKAVYTSDRSDMIWLPEHVEAFWRHARDEMKLALIMALNLGRRQGDLIKITWGDYDGEFIRVTNNKSSRKIRFPARVTQGLRASLETYRHSLGRPVHREETILLTRTGQPWVEGHFSTKFSQVKNMAGLTDLHFHDLRGTAVTVLAENGCTTPEIASITGHTMKQVEAILEKYMARTRALNDAATRKLEESWISKIGMRE